MAPDRYYRGRETDRSAGQKRIAAETFSQWGKTHRFSGENPHRKWQIPSGGDPHYRPSGGNPHYFRYLGWGDLLRYTLPLAGGARRRHGDGLRHGEAVGWGKAEATVGGDDDLTTDRTDE